jgi:hypothetical protein
LYKGLAQQSAKVKVAVVCPRAVSTNIVGRAIKRWSRSSGKTLNDLSAEDRKYMLEYDEKIRAGIPPAEVAAQLFKALREDRFYVLTHPETKELVRVRMEDIINERNPTL